MRGTQLAELTASAKNTAMIRRVWGMAESGIGGGSGGQEAPGARHHGGRDVFDGRPRAARSRAAFLPVRHTPGKPRRSVRTRPCRSSRAGPWR
jgi:hypothetical protein